MAKNLLQISGIKRICPEIEGKQISDLTLIKQGSTSAVYQHPKYPTMILGFTTDKAKIEWFKKNTRRFNFKLLKTEISGSPYDEIHKHLYCFSMKKMEPLSEEESRYIQDRVLSKLTKMKNHKRLKGLGDNLKIFSIAKDENEDRRLKDVLFKLKKFLDANIGFVELELMKSSFLKLPSGEIMLVDPVYSTKERI